MPLRGRIELKTNYTIDLVRAYKLQAHVSWKTHAERSGVSNPP